MVRRSTGGSLSEHKQPTIGRIQVSAALTGDIKPGPRMKA